MTITGPLVDSLNWLFEWFNIDWEKVLYSGALDRLNKKARPQLAVFLTPTIKTLKKLLTKF